MNRISTLIKGLFIAVMMSWSGVSAQQQDAAEAQNQDYDTSTEPYTPPVYSGYWWMGMGDNNRGLNLVLKNETPPDQRVRLKEFLFGFMPTPPDSVLLTDGVWYCSDMQAENNDEPNPPMDFIRDAGTGWEEGKWYSYEADRIFHTPVMVEICARGKDCAAMIKNLSVAMKELNQRMSSFPVEDDGKMAIVRFYNDTFPSDLGYILFTEYGPIMQGRYYMTPDSWVRAPAQTPAKKRAVKLTKKNGSLLNR